MGKFGWKPKKEGGSGEKGRREDGGGTMDRGGTIDGTVAMPKPADGLRKPVHACGGAAQVLVWLVSGPPL